MTPKERLSDLIALAKPSILMLSVMMAALGMWLAPRAMDLWASLGFLVGTGLIVGSANALNMYLERDSDRYMSRTKDRPLPAGRMAARHALLFGLLIGVVGTGVIYVSSNLITTLFGAFALVSYVWVYTPLKRLTPQALLVGAVPGAMPPLMGWTAATGHVDLPGLALFGTLLLWQLPHFIAIAIYRKTEYAAAGIRAVAVVRGEQNAKWQALAYATGLIPVTLALFPLGGAGWIYGVGACFVSVWFFVQCLRGFRTQPPAKWARRVFLASLAYLPALAVLLVADKLIL